MATATTETELELLTVRDVSRLCNVSERHWWTLVSRGDAPKPIRIGRSARWSRRALIAWLDARHREANPQEPQR